MCRTQFYTPKHWRTEALTVPRYMCIPKRNVKQWMYAVVGNVDGKCTWIHYTANKDVNIGQLNFQYKMSLLANGSPFCNICQSKLRVRSEIKTTMQFSSNYCMYGAEVASSVPAFQHDIVVRLRWATCSGLQRHWYAVVRRTRSASCASTECSALNLRLLTVRAETTHPCSQASIVSWLRVVIPYVMTETLKYYRYWE